MGPKNQPTHQPTMRFNSTLHLALLFESWFESFYDFIFVSLRRSSNWLFSVSWIPLDIFTNPSVVFQHVWLSVTCFQYSSITSSTLNRSRINSHRTWSCNNITSTDLSIAVFVVSCRGSTFFVITHVACNEHRRENDAIGEIGSKSLV